jgi:predicted glutamine amidotransferase
MCGLVGMFRAQKAENHLKTEDWITQGLYMSALRGFHGTGLGWVNKDYTISARKTHVASSFWIGQDEYGYAMQDVKEENARVLLGHTRSPTTANTVSTKNAQPFDFQKKSDPRQHIIMTHNGHINNWSMLTPNEFHHPVDSAHVAYSLLMNGEQETLEKLKGFYVLVWYNRLKKTLNIARNESNRDLTLVYDEGWKHIYYMSERKMLQSLMDRTEMPYVDKFNEVPPLEWFCWDLTHKSLENVKIIKYKEAPAINYYMGGSKSRVGDDTADDDGEYGMWWQNHPGFADRDKQVTTPAQPLHDPDYCRIGDEIYAYFYDNAEWKAGSSLQRAYGSVEGVRIKDGAKFGKVTCTGLTQQEWHDFSVLKGALPCKITGLVTVLGENQLRDKHQEEYTVTPLYARINEKLNSIKIAQRSDKEEKTYTVHRLNGREVDTGALPLAITASKLPDLSPPDSTQVSGPEGKSISMTEWRRITQHGCYYMCETPSIDDSQVGKVRFVPYPLNHEDRAEEKEWAVVCETCCKDPHMADAADALMRAGGLH